ncbi:MAG: proton-conducting transporter membrane subunit, partial [Verrucomicrobia bacterium]|nr:proton-conducting transporter membrane subunit [Verrucomicrobiota bacterium]
METLSFNLLALSLLGYFCAAAGGMVLWREDRAANFWCFGLGAAASLCGGVAAVLVLLSQHSLQFEAWPSLIPYLHCSVKLDALGAFFVLVLSALSLGLNVYSLGYAKAYYGGRRVGVLGALFNALLLATSMVFLANNAFLFLIAWEIMALTAYGLVSFEHEKDETRNAGVLYFIMSHIGTGCLILGFLLIFQAAGDYDFDSFRALGAKMSPERRNAAFLLFLCGFGV